MARPFALVAVMLASLALPSLAAAEGAYLGVGVGPAVHMDDWPTQVRVEQEIGYFVSGSPRGFYVAFAPSQSWGNDWWVLVFPVRLGGVFDLYRGSDVSFQLGGTGTLGVAITDQFGGGRDPDAWFHLSFGLLLRLMLLNDRLGIYLRPVEFEFGIGESGAWGNEGIRYILCGGIQWFF